jgi:hypothetical protein
MFLKLLTLVILCGLIGSAGLSALAEAPVAPNVPSVRTAYKVSSATQKVAKGTILKLTLTTVLDSRSARIGESFTALVAEDLYGTKGDILLPRGTTLRGRISDVYSQGFFGKGGFLTLAFDWVTLPTGKEVPVEIEITPLTGFLNPSGQLYKDPGYTQKALKDLDKSGDILTDTTRQSYEYGKSLGSPVLGALFTPLGVIGGTVLGGGYAVGKLTYHAIAKGDPTVIQPNEVLFTEFTKETALPVAE